MIFRPIAIKPMIIALAAGVMLGAVGVSEWVKPNKHWSAVIGEPHYGTLIPQAFGDWVALEHSGRVVVNPVQEENLMRLYTETLARGYVHRPTGRVIMLSIAYGKDQSTDTQLHTPDACYPSQGFRVENRSEHDVQTPYGAIPAVRLLTTFGSQRTEPLTYFIRVGDGLARGSKDRNLARLSMAVKGYLVDGMLFRISEVTQRGDAYALQDQFIKDLLGSLSSEARGRVIGGLMPTL